MKKMVLVCAISLMVCGIAFADVLPGTVPEKQVFGTTSAISGVALTFESTSFAWHVGDQKSDEIPLPYGDPYGRGSVKSGSISYSLYKDIINSNGGMISEVKAFNLDTNAKWSGMYNVNTEKLLTYNSQMGSHLLGDELYILDVAGNWTWTPGHNGLVCVFSAAATESLIPAFCSKVTAAARLTSITTAQVQAAGSIKPIASSVTVPAALNYEISVTPDANSASGYADGIVSTTFTVSVQEGRIDGNFSPGLVPNMLVPYGAYTFHGAGGMYLNAGSIGSFVYGETTANNSIFIGNSSGYRSGVNDNPYDSSNVGGPCHGTFPDVNVGCDNGSVLTVGSQLYWLEDVIIVIKDGVTIFDSDSTMLLTGKPSRPTSTDAGGTSAQPLDDGYEIVLDGLLITKNGGGYNPTTGEPEEVSWTVEFTDYFGRIPPGSTYTLQGRNGNHNYNAPFIQTGVPFLEFYDQLSASLTAEDTTTVAGGISTFIKSFDYISGTSCQNC